MKSICKYALVLLCGLSHFLTTVAAQPRRFPAFTLVAEITDYDEKGRAVGVTTYTRYQSSNGEWRDVMEDNGYVRSMLYRLGQGAYKATSRTGVLIKGGDRVPTLPMKSAAEFKADPHFVGTTVILGFTAYIHRWQLEGDELEEYYVPELGGLSIRGLTNYANGTKTINEPVSVLVGEPARQDLTGPDYPIIEQRPLYVENLGSKLLTKPDPVYPPQAIKKRIAGTASVQVTVDTQGRVVFASATSALPYIEIAAEEAAFNASFKPIIIDGKPTVVYGYIEYEFVLPQAQGSTATVTDAQKKELLSLLTTLPRCGEFFCDEAVEKTAPFLPVLFALNQKDLAGFDIYAIRRLKFVFVQATSMSRLWCRTFCRHTASRHQIVLGGEAI